MIDEEFYIEETSPVKVFFTILFFILLLSAIGAVYYFYFYHEPIRLKDIELELGSAPSLDVNDYLKNIGRYDFPLDISKLSVDEDGKTNAIGEYSYEVIVNEETLRGKIFVVDTTPPEVTLRELIIGLGEEYDLDDFLVTCEDYSVICHVNYANDKDEDLINEEGTHKIKLNISDIHGNTITKTAILIVDKDASLYDLKASNEEVSQIYPLDDEWDGTYTVKPEKGFLEDSEEFETEILKLANSDISSLFEESIKETKLLTIYNKYNYVIGFSLKVTFENEVIYLSESEYSKLEIEDET